MQNKPIITCAVTGAGDTVSRHPGVPVTPEQIATAALEAASAGAAIVHIHVRDPQSGKGSRDPKLFAEVVDRIRTQSTDVVINLTAGMGGDLVLGEHSPLDVQDGTDMAPPLERLLHVEELRPEICSLDCGSMNFGNGYDVMTNAPAHLRLQAQKILELGVKPELEVFDSGHLWFANRMVEEGLVARPPLYQICLGIPYGAPATTASMKNMVDMLPDDANWTAFGISRMQMPMAAQAILLGGNVRVGLEDNLYLSKGVLASNAQLVEQACQVVHSLGCEIATAAEARQRFGLSGAK